MDAFQIFFICHSQSIVFAKLFNFNYNLCDNLFFYRLFNFHFKNYLSIISYTFLDIYSADPGCSKNTVVVEFHRGGSATNGATPSSSNCVHLFSCSLSNFHHLWALGGNIDGGKMCSNHLYIPHSQRYRNGFAQLHIYGYFKSNNGVRNKLNKKLIR